MTNSAPQMFLLYYPLWGASFDSDESGLVGGRAMVYIPHRDEWCRIQKLDVWTERWRANPYDLQGPEPPPCLVAAELSREGEDFFDLFSRVGEAMVADVNDAVLAFRLFKAGWFLDPDLAERVFSFSYFNHRMLGPYRQVFMTGAPDDVLPGYDLHVADLITPEQEQKTPITRNWELARQYRETSRHSSADIAIENFHRSYGYQLAGFQRSAFLFIALDAMLGGMSSRSIGPASLRDRYKKRVTTALGIARESGLALSLEPDEEASWLDTQRRKIRNAIAHGQPTSVSQEAEESYERIQDIVRSLLRQYLAFSVSWAVNPTEIAEWLGLEFEYPPIGVYNLFLEAHARGRITATELLNFAN